VIEASGRGSVQQTVRLAGNAGVEEQESEPLERDAEIQGVVGVGVRLLRKGRAQRHAGVVISRDRRERQRERGEQAFEMRVFLWQPAVDQVAGRHDHGRRRLQRIELRDAACQRRRGVDFPVGEFARTLDMQVGDLSDGDGRRCHRRGSSSRTAAGSIGSPTRSPTRTFVLLAASMASGRSAASVTVSRTRSPTKLTVSTFPRNLASPGATILIVSGRIMTTTVAAVFASVNPMRPPGSAMNPSFAAASMMLAAPMNSATKRSAGVK